MLQPKRRSRKRKNTSPTSCSQASSRCFSARVLRMRQECSPRDSSSARRLNRLPDLSARMYCRVMNPPCGCSRPQGGVYPATKERSDGQAAEKTRQPVPRYAEGHLLRREEDPDRSAENGQGRAERGPEGRVR